MYENTPEVARNCSQIATACSLSVRSSFSCTGGGGGEWMTGGRATTKEKEHPGATISGSGGGLHGGVGGRPAAANASPLLWPGPRSTHSVPSSPQHERLQAEGGSWPGVGVVPMAQRPGARRRTPQPGRQPWPRTVPLHSRDAGRRRRWRHSSGAMDASTMVGLVVSFFLLSSSSLILPI